MKILNSYKPELKNPQENPFEKSLPDGLCIFLLRHGQINGSDKKKFIGTSDIPLDPIGISQALYWERTFSSMDFDFIYSSSLQRCRQTAGLIAKGKKVINAPALNEINMGAWDGESFDKIKTAMPQEFEKRGQMMDKFRPPGGESFLDLSKRVWPFFESMEKKSAKRILIVTHAGVIRVILCRLMELPLKELFKIKLAYSQLYILSSS